MKNKDKYNLSHLDFANDKMVLFNGKPQNHVTLYYENKPILTFYTEKTPIKAILDWAEEELEDY